MQNKKSHIKIEKKYIGDNGYFEGYASIFNELDYDGDIILPGAFRESLLLNKSIKLLWQHNPEEPIGSFIDVFENTNGLYVKAELILAVSKGKEAYALMKAGALDSMSIGYRVDDFFYAKGFRYIKKLSLWEISLVTFPANERAKITDCKYRYGR